jgi:hypothetical protein
MIGEGMAGSGVEISSELPPRNRTAFMPGNGPKSRPVEVRASVVVRKRVTTVERRDAGKWKREGANERTQTSDSGREGREPGLS